jgi:hypothetical protein
VVVLAACSGRPHPVDYYKLVKVDDSLKTANLEILSILTAQAEDQLDTTPLPPGYSERPSVRVGNIENAVEKMNDFLSDIKVEIFDRVDGNLPAQSTMMSLKDMQHPGNTDVTTHYFIGDDPKNITGKAKELKEKLFRLGELLKQNTHNKIAEVELSGITVKDEPDWNGRTVSWEVAHFYKVTAAEAYVELTRLQNAVLRAGLGAADAIHMEEIK